MNTPCFRGLALAIATTAATAAIPTAARAVVIASDSFDYPTGNLAGQNGGVGFSTAYTASGTPGAQVITPGLTYGGLTTSGNAASTNSSPATGAGNQGAFRDLTAGTLGTDGTSVFIGFLATVPGTLPNYAGISLFQAANENLFLGKPTGIPSYGFDRSGVAGVEGNSGVAAGATTAYLVYQIDFGAGTTTGNEKVQLFVNPGPGLTPPGTAQAVNADINSFTFNRIRLQSGDQPITFDEIRIGTTYADVAPVPEPAAAGLAAGAAGLLATRRRRRRRGESR